MIRSGSAGENLKSESGGRGAFGLAKMVSLAISLYLRRFACMILLGSVAALRKRFILYLSLNRSEPLCNRCNKYFYWNLDRKRTNLSCLHQRTAVIEGRCYNFISMSNKN